MVHYFNTWLECTLLFLCTSVSSTFSTQQFIDRESQAIHMNNISHLWLPVRHQNKPVARKHQDRRNILIGIRRQEKFNCTNEHSTSAKHQTHSKQMVTNTREMFENYEKQIIASKLRDGFSYAIFGKNPGQKRNIKTEKSTLKPHATTVEQLLQISNHVPKRQYFLKGKTMMASLEKAVNSSPKPWSLGNDDKPKCAGGYKLNFLANVSRVGALCLDGSPPGYYYRRGRDNAINKWIIYIQGGAWCENVSSCLKRSHTMFGSSNLFPVCMNGEGLLSPDPKYNPDFHNWTFVFIGYCDGSSFTGNRVMPLKVKDKTLYFRGKLIMKALIDEFMRTKGLRNATEVIFGGRSAGGLSAIIHANYVRSRLSHNTSFRVLSDAGFFVDSPSSDGKELIRSKMKQMFYFHNSSSGLDSACIQAQTLNERWKCFFPQYSTHFVKAPLYLINPLYDLWQIVYVQGIKCAKKLNTCNKTDRQKVLDFRNKTLNALTQVFLNHKCAGYFDSCLAHSQTVLNDVWGVVQVRNVTMATAFSEWYFGKLKSNERFRIDGPYPCNQYCPSNVVL